MTVPFFASALSIWPVDASITLYSVANFEKTGMVLSLARIVLISVNEIALLSVFHGYQFYFSPSYLEYHCSFVKDWPDEDCVGWFQCVCSGEELSDVTS